MNKNLYEQFRTKKPRYPKMYEESVIKKLAAKGTDSGTHQDTYERGKFFYNLYQCYIYAAFIGIRLNKRQPFDKKDGKDFAEIFWWESTAKDIVKYLFTGLVALSDKSLMQIQVSAPPWRWP